MSKDDPGLPSRDSRAQVDAFLRKVAETPPARAAGARRGRLLFAMDATASREPTWDRASDLQARMFEETASLGGLDVQLVWYRGFHDFGASEWCSSPEQLLPRMTAVRCAAGMTQIAGVLRHALAETRREQVSAVVFVGDCMEESIDELCGLAGELGVLSVPVFVFHEGEDPIAGSAFREIARLSGGACCAFDATSARQLRDLLSAVAVYAAGGRRALEDFGNRRGGVVKQLTHQIGSR